MRDPEGLVSVLERLGEPLGIDLAKAHIELLHGGGSNRTYRLRHGADQWVIRMPPGRGDSVTLTSESEERVVSAAASTGITPDVVLRDSHTGVLVTRYLGEAVPWRSLDARTERNIERIAGTLRRLHAVEVRLQAFTPVSLASGYLEAARRSQAGRGRDLDGEEVRWGDELRRLAERYEASFASTSLCHNDLVAANVLDDGRLWLVDFEYARRAHPILDLASLAAMNDYGVSERRALWVAYHGLAPSPRDEEWLQMVVRLVRLTSYFWALARWSDAPQPDAVRRVADAMMTRLRTESAAG